MIAQPRKAVLGSLALSLLAAAAWGVDLSCIGVQNSAAQWGVSQLPQDQQGQFQSTVGRLQTMARDAAAQVQGVEMATQQDWKAVADAHPGATTAEIGRLYQEQIKTSAQVDNNYADALKAQYQAHMTEGMMIAASAAIPLPAERVQAEQTLDRYTARTPQLQAVRSNPDLARLLTVVAAANAAVESGAGIPAHGLGSIGWDTAASDPNTAAVVRALAAPAVAAAALQTTGELRLGHLSNQDARDRNFRVAVVQDQRSSTGQEIAREMAAGLENHHLSGLITQKIASVVPPPPPPSPPSGTDSKIAKVVPPSPPAAPPGPPLDLAAQLLARAKAAANGAGVIVRKAAPKIIGEVDGALGAGVKKE